MNISLTKELEKFVHGKVKSGLYRSASEVVRECVRRFQQEDVELANLRREINKGLQDIKKGNIKELDMEGIILESKTLHAKKKRNT